MQSFPNKVDLLGAGRTLMEQFCEANALTCPPIQERDSKSWPFGVCAYYRPTKVVICLARCAPVGVAGPAWSYPGYIVDRTPYGVLQHELGHHADIVLSGRDSGYRGEFSIAARKEAGEPPITSYCPDDAEWFAEAFRLFVTNPGLLELLRPRTFELLRDSFVPVMQGGWESVLAKAPARTIQAARSKIDQAQKLIARARAVSGKQRALPL